ncbi:hypothetical protein K1719_009754 [Acacia pycnantha]|nr:hypothetical protein K1719_009754 [Acacia pycnantha]
MEPLDYELAMRLIVRIMTCLQQNLRNFKAPFLVLHGTADTVTDPAASMKFYEEASHLTNQSVYMKDCYMTSFLNPNVMLSHRK